MFREELRDQQNYMNIMRTEMMARMQDMDRETYVRQEQYNQEAMQLRQVFRNEIN